MQTPLRSVFDRMAEKYPGCQDDELVEATLDEARDSAVLEEDEVDLASEQCWAWVRAGEHLRPR
jgi:hypothetical protein